MGIMTRQAHKVTIKRRGWSQQKAAAFIGVSYEHLNRVLNGHRESRRLLAAIEALPERAAGGRDSQSTMADSRGGTDGGREG